MPAGAQGQVTAVRHLHTLLLSVLPDDLDGDHGRIIDQPAYMAKARAFQPTVLSPAHGHRFPIPAQRSTAPFGARDSPPQPLLLDLERVQAIGTLAIAADRLETEQIQQPFLPGLLLSDLGRLRTHLHVLPLPFHDAHLSGEGALG